MFAIGVGAIVAAAVGAERVTTRACPSMMSYESNDIQELKSPPNAIIVRVFFMFLVSLVYYKNKIEAKDDQESNPHAIMRTVMTI